MYKFLFYYVGNLFPELYYWRYKLDKFKYIIHMNFAKQKKRLDTLLKQPNNHTCADCNTLAPTWASLDFGVFLCSSCSGAHRAMGPTITRVKSVHLDVWDEEWYRNMVIGNVKLNKYWESNTLSAVKKPKSGATNMEVERYVYEKYIKRKYVTDLNCPDPLTAYKRNNYQFYEEQKDNCKEVAVWKNKAEVLPAKMPAVKKVQNLIDFELEREVKSQNQLLVEQKKQVPKIEPCEPVASASNNNTSDICAEIGTSFTSQNSKEDFISFEELLKTQKTLQNSLQHFLSTQQINKTTASLNTKYQHPYQQHLPTQNLLCNSYFYPSSAHSYSMNYLQSHSRQLHVIHFSGQCQLGATHYTSNVCVEALVNTDSFNWS